MEFEEQLALLRQRCDTRVSGFLHEMLTVSLTMLWEDLVDPDLNAPDRHPDTFMMRANQVALSLLENHAAAMGARVLKFLEEETTSYRERSGNWRHTGALHANLAGAAALQGNLDGAVYHLLRAAADDVQTYSIGFEQSYAVTHLLKNYILEPGRVNAARLAQMANPALTPADFQALDVHLREGEYAVLAYLLLSVGHENARRQFPNVFSDLQVFGVLRSLSALLEVELKSLALKPDASLFPALEALYKAKPWWGAFDTTRHQVGATRHSGRSVDDQLRDVLALKPADDCARFWKSLLVVHIVRNYTTHKLDTNCALAQTNSEETLGHILHVMARAPAHQ